METKYSIKDLEHLSGIKAHTIRAWESRYNIISPQRTGTNIRYYGDEDMKKLLNIAVLVRGGRRISNVARLSDEQIRAAVIDAGRYQGHYESQINGLKLSMLEYDEYLFDSIFNKCLIQFGTDETLTKILGSFIEQVGILWQVGAIGVSNEHFIANLIKQKLFSIIDQTLIPAADKFRKSYLLYLPTDELHELGLLYLYYFLKKNNNRVIYLGQSVPLEYLKEVSVKTGIKNFVSIFTCEPRFDEMDSYFEKMTGIFPAGSYRFYLSGFQLTQNNYKQSNPPHVEIFPDLEAMTKTIG